MTRLVVLSTLLSCAACASSPAPKTELSASRPEPEDRSPTEPPADVAAPAPDALVTKSGLAHKLIEPGHGTERPRAWDRVTVHYSGWTTDGALFDSSYERGRPLTVELDKVVPGWSEGVQLMTVGEKRRLWIPEALAYQGRPGAPAGTLVFDVQLVSIERLPEPPAPPPPPADVAAAPASAQRTASGIAFAVLRAGTGTVHPTANSRVTVHYTGWTTDGHMFDSSVTRGQSASFGLSDVIAGWSEAVQLMVEGEKTRFWIPEALAYKGRPGAPAGTLVFEIELLSIAAE